MGPCPSLPHPARPGPQTLGPAWLGPSCNFSVFKLWKSALVLLWYFFKKSEFCPLKIFSFFCDLHRSVDKRSLAKQAGAKVDIDENGFHMYPDILRGEDGVKLVMDGQTYVIPGHYLVDRYAADPPAAINAATQARYCFA